MGLWWHWRVFSYTCSWLYVLICEQVHSSKVSIFLDILYSSHCISPYTYAYLHAVFKNFFSFSVSLHCSFLHLPYIFLFFSSASSFSVCFVILTWIDYICYLLHHTQEFVEFYSKSYNLIFWMQKCVIVVFTFLKQFINDISYFSYCLT